MIYLTGVSTAESRAANPSLFADLRNVAADATVCS